MSVLAVRRRMRNTADIFRQLHRYRQLTLEMTRREIGDRYAGQFLGKAWAIGHPLIMMLVLVVIFAYVFKVDIKSKIGLDYTAYLLAGLIPWITVQEVMAKGATVVVGNANLVKQVVFPIEVLPVKSVMASLLSQLVAMAALVLYVLLRHWFVPASYLLLVPLLLVQILGMLGLSALLAALGVYFRDLKDLVQVFCFAGMYAMPLFYNIDMVPPAIKPFVYANPFTYMLLCYQDACFHGGMDHPYAWVVFTVLSLGTFYAGMRVFERLKPLFGNVL
jgi:lipopolysaccharide transport system permease protein